MINKVLPLFDSRSGYHGRSTSPDSYRSRFSFELRSLLPTAKRKSRITFAALRFPLCPLLKMQTQHGLQPCGFVFRPRLTKASF